MGDFYVTSNIHIGSGLLTVSNLVGGLIQINSFQTLLLVVVPQWSSGSTEEKNREGCLLPSAGTVQPSLVSCVEKRSKNYFTDLKTFENCWSIFHYFSNLAVHQNSLERFIEILISVFFPYQLNLNLCCWVVISIFLPSSAGKSYSALFRK